MLSHMTKPWAPGMYQPPDDTKIKLHPGESKTGFDFAIKNENFLGEMLKFFPNFIQEGLDNGVEAEHTMDGIGSWDDSAMMAATGLKILRVNNGIAESGPMAWWLTTMARPTVRIM